MRKKLVKFEEKKEKMMRMRKVELLPIRNSEAGYAPAQGTEAIRVLD